ncbi:MAG: glycosyltransferase [Mycoplasma sp.]
MFRLKARDKKNKLNYILNILTWVILIVVNIIGVSLFGVYVANGSNQPELIIASTIFSLGFSAGWIVGQILYRFFYDIYLKKLAKYEELEIYHSTKLPKDKPKVVCVYTIHDDLFPAKVLHLKKQTYKNIEIWISDGSEKPENKKFAKEFALKNGINYYRLSSPSKNKGDNLNRFLKYSGAKFDYLMIQDPDVIIPERFIESSLRFFYSKNNYSNKLGYISPCIYTYRGKSIFSEMFRIGWDGLRQVFDGVKWFSPNSRTNFYSACCLIKKEVLIDEQNPKQLKFPDGSLEDWYLEIDANRAGWHGIINLLCVAREKFDENPMVFQKRQVRIANWLMKYEKEKKFKNFNERYSSDEMATTAVSFVPLLSAILIFLVFPLAFWVFYSYWNTIFSITTLFIPICVVSGLIVVFLIINWIYLAIRADTKSILKRIFSVFFVIGMLLAIVPRFMKTFIDAFFKSKYEEFSSSIKSGKQMASTRKKLWLFVIPDIIWNLILAAVIAGTITLFVLTKAIENQWLFLLFSFIVIPSGVLYLATLFEIIFMITGIINTNKKYSDDLVNINWSNKRDMLLDVNKKFYKKNRNIPKSQMFR